MSAPGFQGRVALVTGGTRGIGQSVVEHLVARGAAVAVFYAAADDRARDQAEAYRLQGASVAFCKVSVDDPVAVFQAVAQIENTLGPIDYLVNNAGVVRDNWAALMTDEEWNAVFRVNFYGTAVCAQAVIPAMAERGRGAVVNVVSVSGIQGRASQSNYSAAKGAVIGLTRLLAHKYGTAGVRINAVAPGLVATDMMAATPSRAQRALLDQTDLKRPGQPQEIAGLIIAALDEGGGYSSGAVFVADGGLLS